MNLLADNVCRHKDYYENMITDNMFCAGRPDWSQDACEVYTLMPVLDVCFDFGAWVSVNALHLFPAG